MICKVKGCMSLSRKPSRHRNWKEDQLCPEHALLLMPEKYSLRVISGKRRKMKCMREGH